MPAPRQSSLQGAYHLAAIPLGVVLGTLMVSLPHRWESLLTLGLWGMLVAGAWWATGKLPRKWFTP